MSEKTSTAWHLSGVMTTHQGEMLAQTTTGETGMMSSSSSRDAVVYFECFVVVIGVIGTAANGLVLYALVVSKQHKKHVLIVNQNVLDFLSCLFLAIVYAMKLFNMHLSGSQGYWLCKLVFNESLSFSSVHASYINLAFIAIERYLKIIHSVWSKKHLRNWMLYSAMAFAWIGGYIQQLAMGFESSAVIHGVCYGYVVWKNVESKVAACVCYFLSAYVAVLAIAVFCYGNILMVIRRQARVMASHNDAVGPSIAQTQANKIQTSVVKTMILVCAFYGIAWLPEKTYIVLMSESALRIVVLMSLGLDLTQLNDGYYVVMVLGFLYI